MTDIEEWYCRIPPRASEDPALSKRGFRVLIALGRHLDKDAQCWASQSTLGRWCGIARQKVGETIRELEDLGYVCILGRKHRACLYQVLDIDPAKPRAKRKRNKGARHAPPGGAQETPEVHPSGGAGQDQKNLGTGVHDLAPPGGAQTSREPEIPPYPPLERGVAEAACAANRVSDGGPPDGGQAEPASPAPDATKNQKAPSRRERVERSKRPTATKCAPKGLSGALVSKAANGLGSPAKKPATRQDGFQRALQDINAADQSAFTLLAMEEGEEAALAAYGYDRHGKKLNGTRPP